MDTGFIKVGPEAEQELSLEKENSDFLPSFSFPYRAYNLGTEIWTNPNYNTKGLVLGMTGGNTFGSRTQEGH